MKKGNSVRKSVAGEKSTKLIIKEWKELGCIYVPVKILTLIQEHKIPPSAIIVYGVVAEVLSKSTRFWTNENIVELTGGRKLRQVQELIMALKKANLISVQLDEINHKHRYFSISQ